MSKNLVKVFKVHQAGDPTACYLVEARANETPYNYTFSHAEAQKSKCHRVGKHGEWAPTPEEALSRFYKGHAHRAELHARLLVNARQSMEGAQMLAKNLDLPPLVATL